MSNKFTVRSPSNIAFIKYWGAEDLARAIPANPSLSMTLRSCYSRSTVEWLDEAGEHEVRWRAGDVTTEGGKQSELETAPPAFAERIHRHLDVLREWSERGGRFRVATENSFPSAAGMASSASGFSALTLATLGALGLEVSAAEQSVLARRSGSGSAARSVMGGYVEWPADGVVASEALSATPAATPDVECYAQQVATADHWDLRNVIAVVQRGAKSTSSLDGHRRARTSPYWTTRQQQLPGRLNAVREALEARDLERLGTLVEAEAIDLHCVAMTSTPPIFYWRPATLLVLAEIRAMRRDGVAAYGTMDAGANVHVICSPESENDVASRLGRLDIELSLIHDGVGNGPVVEAEHLF